ncbi:MAG: VOC family protein [Chthoniobacterales bacterium]|nr:VOC family protein [Chthoniobacterales bacterium]
MNLEGLDHIAISVRDVERSVQWYLDVLGLERQHADVWDGVPQFVGKGATGIAIFPARESSDGAGKTPSVRMRHFALRADRANFLQAQRELNERGIDFEFEDHEIAHSIYFRDPDGFDLEITTYEVE